MRNIIILLMLTLTLFSCEKETVETFDVELSADVFTFTEIPGGAEMNFTLVKGKHERVFEIEAEYTNHWGEKIVKTAYYLSEKIVLDGFVGAEQSVPVRVYVKDNKENKSQPIDLTFSTSELQSNSIITVDDNITVYNSWNGFRVQVDSTYGAEKGTMFVGYRGIDPLSNQEKDITIKSLPIADAMSLSIVDVIGENAITDSDNNNTVVLWIENEYSQLVYRKEYKAKFLPTTKLDGANITMLPSSILKSVESGDTIRGEIVGDNYGWKYLFDGDTKGEKSLTDFRMTSFLSKDNMRREDWQFDLGADYVLAQVRIYSQYWCAVNYPSPWYVPYRGSDEAYNRGQSLVSKIPSDFEVYGQAENSSEWVLLGTYNSPRGRVTMSEDAWYFDAVGLTNSSNLELYGPYGDRVGFTILTDIANIPPVYALLSLDVTDQKFRYLRLEVLDTFITDAGPNTPINDDYDSNRPNSTGGAGNQIAFSELEVYVQE